MLAKSAVTADHISGGRVDARFASEYNVVFASPAEAAEARGRLDDACRAAGRDVMPELAR